MFFPITGPVASSTNFKAQSYTGTGANQSVTGLGFQPNLVVTKRQVGGAQAWNCQDSIRGISSSLDFASGNAEITGLSNYITSFDSGGFSLGTNTLVNNSGSTYWSFSWKETANFFDVVQYAGTSGSQNISHTLGVVPEFIIVRRTSTSGNWTIYHSGLGNTKNINWGGGGASVATDVSWDDTTPTSSVFSVNSTAGRTNGLGQTYISYLFASVAGKSSVGTYVGNGSSSGPSVNCGFQPSLVMIIRSNISAADVPVIFNGGGSGNVLLVTSTADSDSSNYANFTVTGFTIASSDARVNFNAATYLYVAWA